MYRKKFSKLLFVLGFLFLIQNCSIQIQAQSVSESDVEESERRKKIAENKKAESEAKFPKPDVDSLVGGTTVNEDSEFIETHLLGYCAMKTAARRIANRINPVSVPIASSGSNSNKYTSIPENSTLIIYNENDVKILARYTLLMNRLKILEEGYKPLTGSKTSDIERSAPVGLALNTALNYLSLFKTDIEISGLEFDISEKELVAEVFSLLRSDKYNLYYPKTLPLSLQGCPDNDYAECSPLYKKIILVSDSYERAKKNQGLGDEQKIIRDKLDKVFELTMKELGLFREEPPKPASTINSSSNSTSCPEKNCSTTTVNVNVNKDQEEANGGAGRGNTDKTFVSYLQAENLYKEMEKGNSYWIDMQVVKAGGNMRIKSNFITNFMIGSRVNFSGGAIVYFNVFNNKGASKASGVFQTYEKYRKSSRINETCN